jgi:copper chaperone CopZ
MYELTVEDMTCKHCVGRVTKAVQEIDQAAKVDIDLPTKKVKIDSSGRSRPHCRRSTRPAIRSVRAPDQCGSNSPLM